VIESPPRIVARNCTLPLAPFATLGLVIVKTSRARAMPSAPL